MSIALAGRSTLQRADQFVARFSPATRGLLIFIFHPFFASEAEIERAPMHPHERATGEGLKRLFAYFREHRVSTAWSIVWLPISTHGELPSSRSSSADSGRSVSPIGFSAVGPNSESR